MDTGSYFLEVSLIGLIYRKKLPITILIFLEMAIGNHVPLLLGLILIIPTKISNQIFA